MSILDVKKLQISFRTVNGKVQAVRQIDFSLEKGETLAIVGESGSGKSVTSKAIMGILAGNSIIEGGEILYDGKDLLKISEEDFYKLRGDKIAMIFQDPLSSLNPIMRIGKQLTEAMILKGKAGQKSAREAFNSMLKNLKDFMIAAIATDASGVIDEAKAAEITAKCEKFDNFEFKHVELEQAYNKAVDAGDEAVEDIANILFLIEKNAFKDPVRNVQETIKFAVDTVNPYVVSDDADRLNELCDSAKRHVSAEQKKAQFTKTAAELAEIKAIIEKGLAKTAPNFFTLGYCLANEKTIPEGISVEELNAYTRKVLDDDFMLDFIADVEKALLYADKHYAQKRTELIAEIDKAIAVASGKDLDAKSLNAMVAALEAPAKEVLNKLDIEKDSTAYTFISGLKDMVGKYCGGLKNNGREYRRYNRQVARYDKLVAAGKEPGWKVTPAAVVDLELTQENILDILTNMKSHCIALNAANLGNITDRAVAIIDYLKECASGVVYKVTQGMAKRKAIKLMEEVGIPEPYKRYRQYPFEFSGGMRQRIVIAIALAANPDILICDEPTTALDVTIQAQILELINELKRERDLSVIFITHDLGVVANMADRIAVMYAGKIVETGTAEEIFYSPAHPYTWALLASMPDLDTEDKLEAIPGTPPNMIYPPKGDAFAERNKYALKIDYEMQPPMFKISDTHYAATWLLHPDAPKVEPPKAVTDRIKRMNERRGGAN